jgi:single-stranded-DNA-specific exonuclease
MKYKQNGSMGFQNPKEEILARRGISDPTSYMNSTDENIIPYSLLGEEITMAHIQIMKSISENDGVGLLVDSDPDGLFSASMLYQYFKKAFNVEPVYYLHEGKGHGLSDKETFGRILNDVKSGKVKLLMVSDAGSGDVAECKILSEAGAKIIISDHHTIEKENPYAIVINPQKILGYPNLDSSGCLVTYKMLKGIDDSEWTNFADEYLDLVACSLISDSMDIRNIENRRFIDLGFSNIKNKFLNEFVTTDFRMKELTPISIAFYLVPTINGMVRSGEDTDKLLLFRALCQMDEEFDYTNRKKETIKESIYTRAIRLCTNSKSRQDRAVLKNMETVIKDIETNNRNNNKILFALADETIDKNFTGLVCQKLASLYGKPCVLLRENDKGLFTGSARNINNSPLTDLKGFLKSIGYLNWAMGHSSAFGLSLTKKQLIKTIELSNEKLKDYDFSQVHEIDYIFDYSDLSELNSYFLSPLYDLRFFWAKGIDETKILIKNVKVNSSKISFFGARENSDKKNNWKFELAEGIDVLNFRADDEDYIYKQFANNDGSAWDGVDVFMDVVAKIGRTDYNGESRWCMIVEEYETKQT